jgi:outer membrane protein OmpA-like peptidoglycan-associated protein/tetratricopeptide (TPR) repeat protein
MIFSTVLPHSNMKNIAIALFALVFITNIAVAQPGKSKGSSGGNKTLAADDLMRNGNYFEAAAAFKQAVAKNEKNNTARLKLADCSALLHDYRTAAQNYKYIYEQNTSEVRAAYPNVGFYYGKMLKQLGNYETARGVFMRFIEANQMNTDPQTARLIALAKVERDGCALETGGYSYLNATCTNIGTSLNGAYNEGGASFTSNDRMLYAGVKTTTPINEKIKEKAFAQLYEAAQNGTAWGDLQPLAASINAPEVHNAHPAMSPDGKRLYFTRATMQNGKMRSEVYMSKVDNGIYSTPIRLEEDFNLPNTSNTMPFVMNAGRGDDLIYFASTRSGGKGGYDIWRVIRHPEGTYERFENIADINTLADEIAPFIDVEGKLFFSSDGQPGFGGLDVFSFEVIEQEPIIKNLGKPINSPADDFGFSTDKTGVKGLMISNRVGSTTFDSALPNNSDDIFSVTIDRKKPIKPNPNIIADITNPTTETTKRIVDGVEKTSSVTKVDGNTAANSKVDITINVDNGTNPETATNTTNIDKNGNLLDANGKIIAKSGDFINKEGETTDKNGNTIDTNGNITYKNGAIVDTNGNLLDANGKIVAKSGDFINKNGVMTDKNGNTIDANGNITYKNGAIVDTNGNLLDANGKIIAKSGDFTNKNGVMTDKNGNTIDANGNIIYKNGAIVDTNGNLLDANGKIIAKSGDFTNKNGVMTDKNGNTIDANGNIIYKNGAIVDTNGNLLDANGKIIAKSGDFINKNGVMTDKSGNIMDKNGKINPAVATTNKTTNKTTEPTTNKTTEPTTNKTTNNTTNKTTESTTNVAGSSYTNKNRNNSGVSADVCAKATLYDVSNGKAVLVKEIPCASESNADFALAPNKKYIFALEKGGETLQMREVSTLGSRRSEMFRPKLDGREVSTTLPKGDAIAANNTTSPAPQQGEKFVVKGSIAASETTTNSLAGADVVLYKMQNETKSDEVARQKLAKDNSYSFEVEHGSPYKVVAEKPGFLTVSQEFTANKTAPVVANNEKMVMREKKNNVAYTVKDINYETGNYGLAPEGMQNLDAMVSMLTNNTKIIVEISAHTDNTGTPATNQALSQKRAQAVVDYLVAKGVDRNRLKAQGYGETKPVAPNTSEAGRSKNRRTEFKLLGEVK